MHRKQNASLSYTAVIALGFVFRDTHTDQSSHQSSDSAARTNAGQHGYDGPRGDKWAESRNGQSPDPHQEAKRTADGAPCACSRGGALGGLGVLFVREIFGSLIAGEQYGNILIPESGREQGIDCLFYLNPIRIKAECCKILCLT